MGRRFCENLGKVKFCRHPGGLFLMIGAKMTQAGAVDRRSGRTLLALIQSAAFFLAAFPAEAQILPDHIIKGRHGDWQLECEAAAANAGPAACALMQRVVAEDQNYLRLDVYFQEFSSGNTLLVYAPIGILLTKGVGLRVDNKDVCFAVPGKAKCARFPVLKCSPVACISQIAVSNELLARLKTGKTAIFYVSRTEEAEIGIPVSLKGFAEGVKALGR